MGQETSEEEEDCTSILYAYMYLYTIDVDGRGVTVGSRPVQRHVAAGRPQPRDLDTGTGLVQ